MKRDSSLKVGIVYDAGGADVFERFGFRHDEAIRRIASDVAGCLNAEGFETFCLPIGSDFERAVDALRRERPDVVFNLCESHEGVSGQEGNFAGVLELLRVPFTGNSATTLHLSLRKDLAKSVMESHGIPCPPGFLAHTPSFRWMQSVRFPVIVKPRREDASIGIDASSVVRGVTELRRRVARVLEAHGQEAIVEQYIEGREFSAAMVGGKVLGISEIDFAGLPSGAPHIVTYLGKWDPQSPDFQGTPVLCPAPITGRLWKRIEDLAVRSWRAMEGRGYARVDMRMDRRGRLWVLEFNPNPALARDAGLARVAAVAGWSYSRLLKEIVLLVKDPASGVSERATVMNVEAVP